MENILTIEQTREADAFAITKLGISSQILMENAARSSYEILKETIFKHDNIAIFCGVGNNGGDGLAIARHLFATGHKRLKIFLFGAISKMSPETKFNYDVVTNLQIPMFENVENSFIVDVLQESDVVIEALIGVGADENLRGTLPELLRLLNFADALKIAIDVPAGLNADTGFAHRDAFSADMTLTMFAPKLGIFLNDGPGHCGKVINCNLGAPLNVGQNNRYYRLDDASAKNILGHRESRSDKFDYGRVVVFAGSDNMPGAAALTANSAIKSGAGLVELLTTNVHPMLLPEVIAYRMKSNTDGTISPENLDTIVQRFEKADSIIIGPGIGNNDSTLDLVKSLITNFTTKRIIIDADGLRALKIGTKLNHNVILTPHIYEFARLANISIEEINKDLIKYTKQIAVSLNCNILLKSHPTFITDGDTCFLNTGGNPGMATAGSGDVLSGIIGALACQGGNLLLSSAVAAYIHSRAGDLYTSENEQITLTASTLIKYLPKSFKSVLDFEIE